MDPEMAAHPQPLFKMLRESMPVLPVEGRWRGPDPQGPTSKRSSATPRCSPPTPTRVDLQNIRPLIPLQIDPPDHVKYRKLLDPHLRPQRGGRARGVADRGGQPLDRPVRRSGECDLVRRVHHPCSRPGCSSPSSGSRSTSSTPSSRMKDGIIRPHVRGNVFGAESVAHQKETADEMYAYFNEVLDQRQPTPRRRPAQRVPRRQRRRPNASPARTSSTSASCS